MTGRPNAGLPGGGAGSTEAGAVPAPVKHIPLAPLRGGLRPCPTAIQQTAWPSTRCPWV